MAGCAEQRGEAAEALRCWREAAGIMERLVAAIPGVPMLEETFILQNLRLAGAALKAGEAEVAAQAVVAGLQRGMALHEMLKGAGLELSEKQKGLLGALFGLAREMGLVKEPS